MMAGRSGPRHRPRSTLPGEFGTTLAAAPPETPAQARAYRVPLGSMSAPLGLAGLASAGVTAVWWLAFRVPAVERWDASALNGFLTLQRPKTAMIATTIVSLASPTCFAIIAALVAVMA